MSDENKCVSQEPEFKEPQVVSSSRVVCLLCFIITELHVSACFHFIVVANMYYCSYRPPLIYYT